MANDFLSYAGQAKVNASFNPTLGRLTINGVPVNVGQSGLSYQDGQLVGDTAAYDALLSPFTSPQFAAAKTDQVAQEMEDFKPYETPEEYKAFMMSLIEQTSKKYEYDFDEDPSVNSARTELERSISEMAGSHGFLYSGGTQAIIQEQLSRLTPQFEQSAYNKHKGFLDQQMGFMQVLTQWDQMQYDRTQDQFGLIQTKANFIVAMAENEFKHFRILMEQHRIDQEISLSRERFELQKLQQETDNAYRKIAESGFVDNESARILGVPVGTKARWVQEIELDHQNRLDLMAKENEYNIERANQQFEIEKELVKHRDEIAAASKLKLMEEEFYNQSRLQDLKYVHQKELDAIAAAEQAEIDAQRARERSVKDADKNQYIKMNFTELKTRFRTKFDTDKDGYVDKGKGNAAASWALDELARGVSPALIDQLILSFNIPEYKEPKSSPTDYAYTSKVAEFKDKYSPKQGPVAKSSYGLTGRSLY